jgi:hypothetical protein
VISVDTESGGAELLTTVTYALLGDGVVRTAAFVR